MRGGFSWVFWLVAATWLACLVVLALALLLLTPRPVAAACRPEPITPNTPTGIAGCTIYGTGIASRWQGPGIARNDCVWPWTRCTTIRIISLETRRAIVVTPTMFCDCYTGTEDERLVDLSPWAVAQLGLDWDRGLYPVRVQPFLTTPLPDTALPSAGCAYAGCRGE